MKNDTLSAVKTSLGEFTGEKITDVIYFPSSNTKLEGILLSFSNGFILKIFSFWRIVYQSDIIAGSSDRYLLPTHEAPKRDFEKLSYRESLLYKNMKNVKDNYLDAEIKSVEINPIFDLSISLQNSLSIQILICYRNRPGINYALYKDEEKIWEIKNEEI